MPGKPGRGMPRQRSAGSTSASRRWTTPSRRCGGAVHAGAHTTTGGRAPRVWGRCGRGRGSGHALRGDAHAAAARGLGGRRAPQWGPWDPARSTHPEASTKASGGRDAGGAVGVRRAWHAEREALRTWEPTGIPGNRAAHPTKKKRSANDPWGVGPPQRTRRAGEPLTGGRG